MKRKKFKSDTLYKVLHGCVLLAAIIFIISLVKKGKFMSDTLYKVLRNCVLFATITFIILVVFVVFYNVKNDQAGNVAIKLGDSLYEAMNPELSSDKQEEILRVIGGDHSYKYIAQMKLADLLVQKGELDSAKAIYYQLIERSNSVEYIRDMAEQRLMILENRDVSSSNIYHFSNDMIKVVKLIDSGSIEAARPILQNLNDNFEAPFALKELASRILEALDTPV